MNTKTKLWVGVGTYVIAGASAVALSESGAIAISQETSEAEAQVVVEGESIDSLLLIGQAQTCVAVPVTGGGEGGEEGESLSVEGGEGGEGGEGSEGSSTIIFTPEGSEEGEGSEGAQSFDDRQIVADFVDELIIPNYQFLTQQTGELSEAITAFVADPNSSTLQAARAAWLETRTPWERSEAFAFGPAASLGLDADLDDWPLNEADVLAILNSSDELTSEYVDGLQTSQKGFHAIGFMLFGLDNDKTLSDFTARELEYLEAIAPVFDQTANDLLSSWIIGVNGFPAYRSEFVNAGISSNAYLTMESAGEEIVQGIIGILDELGNIKIGEAVDAQNPFLLESRFAHSSLADFEDNLISARNAYLGDMPARGTDGRGISEYVASVDPALHTEILQQMDVAMAAVQAIPGPIEKTLCDPDAQRQISAARESVLVLFDTFSEEVLPLFR